MTVDLKTGQTYAARREDYCTKIAACEPGGECPLWWEFLERVTAGNGELESYLQRVVGYSLTGITSEHVLFFLYGTGANGKTVFINTIAGMMGDYAVTAPMEMFLASHSERHPTELAMLRGARLVTATETEDGRRWSEAKIKQLTGGDKIAARFMRQDFFEFAPQFKLLISGNHKPSLRSVDEAIRRRIHLIPFTVTIPPDQRDQQLTDKLKDEWPGILSWAIEGCLEWQRTGLAPPDIVRAATDDYLAEEDVFTRWLEDCTESASVWAFERKADLFASWKAWAERAGEFVGTQKRLTQTLEARGFEPGREPGTGQRGLKGIRIKRVDYTDDSRVL